MSVIVARCSSVFRSSILTVRDSSTSLGMTRNVSGATSFAISDCRRAGGERLRSEACAGCRPCQRAAAHGAGAAPAAGRSGKARAWRDGEGAARGICAAGSAFRRLYRSTFADRLQPDDFATVRRRLHDGAVAVETQRSRSGNWHRLRLSGGDLSRAGGGCLHDRDYRAAGEKRGSNAQASRLQKRTRKSGRRLQRLAGERALRRRHRYLRTGPRSTAASRSIERRRTNDHSGWRAGRTGTLSSGKEKRPTQTALSVASPLRADGWRGEPAQVGGSSSPLLDVKNGGEAAKYLASPDGAADPPARYLIAANFFRSMRLTHVCNSFGS